MFRRIATLVAVIGVMLATLVTPAAAAASSFYVLTCTPNNWSDCRDAPTGSNYANAYMQNDDSSGQHIGIGIRIHPYTSGYQVIVPAGKTYVATFKGNEYGSLKAIYIGAGFCTRIIRYNPPILVFPFYPQYEEGAWYYKGPTYIYTPFELGASYRDYSATTYPC